MLFEFAIATAKQFAFDVSWQVTTSLSFKADELKLALLDPVGIPLMAHW